MATLSKLEQQQKPEAGAGIAGAQHVPPPAAAAGPVEQAGFDKPSSAAGGGKGVPGATAGGGGAAAGPAASEAGAPVKDLGVVGRGTKRLNLAPVQVGGWVGGELSHAATISYSEIPTQPRLVGVIYSVI